MITWNDNLWTGEESKSKIASIKRRIRFRRATSAVSYCIALATNSDNLLDIYNMGELLFRYYRDSDQEIHIVGLASSKDEACELVTKMLETVYNQTGGLDVRSYFGK